MKGEYERPVIRFESFELSTTICGSCGAGINSGGSSFGYPYYGSPDTCAFGYSGITMLFLTDTEACTDKVGSENDGTLYCYNLPSGSTSVFTS